MSEESNQINSSSVHVNQANESANQRIPDQPPPSYVEAINSPVHHPKPLSDFPIISKTKLKSNLF